VFSRTFTTLGKVLANQDFLVFAAIAGICFGSLHQGTLTIDGVRYAHIAARAIENQDWLHLQDDFLGTAYANKPPLLFWLVAASLKTLGFSTFAARLPAAAFGFVAMAAFYLCSRRVFGPGIAVLALVLFSLNSVFLRSVPDLSFEGMLLAGSVLCLSGSLRIMQRNGSARLAWTELACGSAIILLSKPPYIVLTTAPLLVSLFTRPSPGGRRQALCVASFAAAAVLLFFSLAVLSFGPGYVTTALRNQLERPFSLDKGFALNLGLWLKAVLVAFAPLSWLACWAFWRKLLRLRRAGSSLGAADVLLFAWAAPIIPIVLLVDYRTQYLLVPFLSLALIAAKELETALPRFNPLRAAQGLCAASVFCAILCQFGLKVHRTEPLVPFLKERFADINPGTLICQDSKHGFSNKPTRRRLELLLELETGRRFSVVSSAMVLDRDTNSSDSAWILAEEHCRRLLETNGAVLLNPIRLGKFSLFRAIGFSSSKLDLSEFKRDEERSYH